MTISNTFLLNLDIKLLKIITNVTNLKIIKCSSVVPVKLPFVKSLYSLRNFKKFTSNKYKMDRYGKNNIIDIKLRFNKNEKFKFLKNFI